MKNKNYKYCLIYLVIFLFGVTVSAGIKFAYGVSVLPEITEGVNGTFSLFDMISFIACFVKPIVVTFLSAFTIYACAISSVSSLFCGMKLGVMTIEYCRSGLNPFTHAASLVFIAFFAFIHTRISTSASLYRASLRYAAPDPHELVRSKGTSALFVLFAYAVLCAIATSAAMYFFIVYFPIVKSI